MNFKKMGKNLLWGILAIIFVWWLWRWVQGQGGILTAFNRAFPGMSTTPDWRYGIPVIRQHPLPPRESPPAVRPHPYQPTPTPVAPPAVRPHPYQPTPTPVAPLPVAPGHPEIPPNIGQNDRLPWENNRRRGEVINALKADIARINRYSREVANTFTEVARVGGVDNYLSMQRERLTRARTLPAFVGPIGARPTVTQPVVLPFTGQAIDPSPLTPAFEPFEQTILPYRPRVSGGGNISTMQGGLAYIQE